MQLYRWLLFDADGTLFDYDRAESGASREAFRLTGVPFDPGFLAAYRRINEALWQALEKGTITPGLLKVRRFELLLESIGVACPPDAFSPSYLEETNFPPQSHTIPCFTEPPNPTGTKS